MGQKFHNLYDFRGYSASLESCAGHNLFHFSVAKDENININKLLRKDNGRHYFKHSAQLINNTSDQDNGKYVFTISSSSMLLTDYIASKPVSFENKIDIAIQIIEYLQSVHINGCICRLLIPEHVFYDEKNNALTIVPVMSSAKVASVRKNIKDKKQCLYISPEEIGGIKQEIDWRSNYYVFGVLLYELIYNKTLINIDALNIDEVINYHVEGVYEVRADKNNFQFYYIDRIINKLLEKNINSRYQFFDEIVTELNYIKTSKEINLNKLVNYRLNTALYYSEVFIDVLKCFSTSESENIRTIIIKGFAGVGKSELINQVSKKCLITNRTLVKGKCEKNDTNTPYMAIKQVFEQLLLTVNSGTLKDAILELTLSNKSINMSSLLSFIPSMSEEGIDDDYKFQKNQNKDTLFDSVFAYLKVLISVGMRIVIVIDDIQWCDAESMDFIERLDSQEITGLRLILSFRSNEIKYNKLSSSFVNARLGDAATKIFTVKGLNYDECRKYVSYVVDDQYDKALTDSIFYKSGGNPLFIKQLLSSVSCNYDEKNVTLFDLLVTPKRISGSKNRDLSFFISKNINSLSEESIAILRYIACYGKPISKKLLSNICDYDDDKVNNILLSVELSEYVAYQYQKIFIPHDKISQYIYESIDITERDLLHINIAKRLKITDDNSLYDIANQYNSLLKPDNDVLVKEIILINISAGKKAIHDLAYFSSYNFFKIAYKWLNKYEDVVDEIAHVDIKYYYAYSCYLSGHYSHSVEAIKPLLKNADNIEKLSLFYALYKDIIINSGGSYDDVVNEGLKVLDSLGVVANEINKDLGVDRYLAQFSSENSIEKNILVDNDNNEITSTMRILLDVWEAAYYAGKTDVMSGVISRIVEITINKGICSESTFGFVMYAVALSKNNKYDLAYSLGKFSLKVLKVLDNKIMFPKVTNLFCNYTAFYGETFSDISIRYNESCNVSRITGDYLFGVWAALFSVWTKFISGAPLTDVYRQSKLQKDFVLKTNDIKMIRMYGMLTDLILKYMGMYNTEHVNGEDKVFSIEDNLSYFEANKFLPGASWYSILYSQFLYIMGDYKQSIATIENQLKVRDIEIVMFPITQLYFYEGLSIVAIARDDKSFPDKRSLENLDRCVKELSLLSEINTSNFLCQKIILDNEISVYLNYKVASLINYDDVVDVVMKQGTEFEIALINELYAEYLLSTGEMASARDKIKVSLVCYKKWGANLKVRQLKQKHESLFLDPNVNISVSPELSHSYDLKMLFEDSQAISSELNIDVLLDKAMKIFIKESGAIKAYYIDLTGESYRLICSYVSGKVTVSPQTHFNYNTRIMSVPVLDYVVNSGSYILLDNACKIGQFTDDPYIKNNAIKSLLCLPIKKHNDVQAALYLENSINTNLFTKDKVDTLNILLSQVVISIENCRLYRELSLQIENNTRTKDDLLKNIEAMESSHEHANMGIWEWDILTDELYWSDHIPYIFGYPDGDLETTYENFIAAVYPDDRKLVENSIKECFEGKDYYVEHRIMQPDGLITWVLETGNVSRNDSGKPVKMFGVIQDITKRKNAELKSDILNKKLLQAQKMESIGHLTGGIAHDFNNILAVIIGYTDLAKMSLPSADTEKTLSFLSQIETASGRAKELVSQMMTFSRKDSKELASVNLTPIVKESVKLLTSTIPSTISFKFVIEDEIPNVVIDPVQAQQIIINLCVNSRDSIDDIGSIRVELKRKTIEGEMCTACTQEYSGDYVELSITDDGSGMPEDIIKKIFDPFFTTKEVGKGTGMGLSVVHGIVHNSNGHVQVYSSSFGTSIRILLPVSSVAEVEILIEESVATKTEKLMANIVVVDDDDALLEMEMLMLESIGARVKSFNNGDDAFEYISKNINDIDLLITDMTMPRMSGAKLAEMVLSVRASLPIILCTGYSETINEDKAYAMGVRGFISKPFKNSDFIKVIKSLI